MSDGKKPVCGANLREKPGETCESPVVMENGRCRIHGGKSPPPGPEHHSYRTGLYSKAVPARLRDRLEQLLTDPEVMSHRRDAALLAARAEELLEQLDTGEAGAAWKRARDLYEQVQAQLRDGDHEGAKVSMDRLGRQLREGAAEHEKWRELRELLDGRRAHVVAEHKRQLDLNQHVTVEQMLVMMYRVVNLVKQLVPDPAVHRALASEMRTLENLEKEH